jgi:hypothetical protein
MISVKRKSMEPILDIKIPHELTEDEIPGSGYGSAFFSSQYISSRRMVNSLPPARKHRPKRELQRVEV